ncbi:MAG: hypothetical protein KDB79_04090, partial [Acidobacteria bacterium]|nr:hypothetical protein [Acidobacteriota bacterium]
HVSAFAVHLFSASFRVFRGQSLPFRDPLTTSTLPNSRVSAISLFTTISTLPRLKYGLLCKQLYNKLIF